MFLEAVRYLNLGWSVIPIRPSDKKPALGSWREYQDEAAPVPVLQEWFKPECEGFYACPNLGIVTGKVSNLVVVDFDGYEGQDPSAFLARHNLSTNAPIAITGKGFHVYYRHPGNAGVRNGVRIGVLSGVGVDLRADGGYVVAPPSIHANGRQYHWAPNHGPERAAAGDLLPEVFSQTVSRDLAQTPLAGALADEGEIARLMRGAGEGGRNHAAAKLTGYWLAITKGNQPAALMAMRAWNSLNHPPLSERELLLTFRSIARRYAETHETDTDEVSPGGQVTVLDAKAWASSVRDIPPRRGVPNPAIPTMDELGGIVERDLVILAGRPGMGKSTAAWGTVVDVGINQKLPTVIFSTEMTASDVARWVASRMFQTPVRDLSPVQWNDTLKAIGDSPLTMIDQGALTVDGILEVVKARPETKLVIVDHIQRINGGRGDSRNQQLGQIAKALKSLAKDSACTVLALSQLNRAGEPGERPRLENLRESGDLEQEADAVIFLWSGYDDPTANPLPVEFYLAKNRHGALAQVEAIFYKSLKRFEAMDFAARMAAIQQELRNKQKLQLLLEGEAA